MVLEDAPAGVAAGRAAGMRVVGVATTHPREELAGADAIVATLADLPAALGELGGPSRPAPPQRARRRGSAWTP